MGLLQYPSFSLLVLRRKLQKYVIGNEIILSNHAFFSFVWTGFVVEFRTQYVWIDTFGIKDGKHWKKCPH